MAARSRRIRAVLPSIVALLAVAMLAGACRTPDSSAAAATRAAKTTGPDAFERSGRSADLRLHLPAGRPTRPYPLVVALHSLFHEGDNADGTWGLNHLADQAGFAVVYPDGEEMSWNAGSCCGQSAVADVDDVSYLRAVISHLEQRYPIDRRRVVLVGLSNGGMLAYRYACDYPAEIAGIAVVAGSLQVAGCHPAAPITVVSVHGLDDALVPYAGQAWSTELQTPITSTHDSLAPFRAVDQCPVPAPATDSIITDSRGDPAVAGVPDPAGPGGSSAIKLEAPCLSPARVVEYVLPATGHGWPPLTGKGHFDTAGAIWQILADARSRGVGPDL